MDINVNFDGSDDLNELERKLEELDGERTVTGDDLFPDEFVRAHTNFQTLQEMLKAGGVEKQEDVESEEFSKFIAANTQFDSWEEMFKAAGAEYYRRQLGFS